MRSRITLWVAVWAIIAIVSVLSYPSGESTLVFGFWPSNHLISWLITALCLVVGAAFAYDLFFNYYPEFDRATIEEIESGSVEQRERTEQQSVTVDRGEL